jgi:hypothetical protein
MVTVQSYQHPDVVLIWAQMEALKKLVQRKHPLPMVLVERKQLGWDES